MQINPIVRQYRESDLDAIERLGLRAWRPVFEAWREVLGDRLYELAFPSWHESQAKEIRETCSSHADRTLVAELRGEVIGFAVVIVHGATAHEPSTGEVEMIAVDPEAQRQGVARALMLASTSMMREAGCALARIGTGGDDGHAPARALYEASGFTALPTVTYYREL